MVVGGQEERYALVPGMSTLTLDIVVFLIQVMVP